MTFTKPLLLMLQLGDNNNNKTQYNYYNNSSKLISYQKNSLHEVRW